MYIYIHTHIYVYIYIYIHIYIHTHTHAGLVPLARRCFQLLCVCLELTRKQAPHLVVQGRVVNVCALALEQQQQQVFPVAVRGEQLGHSQHGIAVSALVEHREELQGQLALAPTPPAPARLEREDKEVLDARRAFLEPRRARGPQSPCGARRQALAPACRRERAARRPGPCEGGHTQQQREKRVSSACPGGSSFRVRDRAASRSKCPRTPEENLPRFNSHARSLPSLSTRSLQIPVCPSSDSHRCGYDKAAGVCFLFFL